jgi:hypothetical protein
MLAMEELPGSARGIDGHASLERSHTVRTLAHAMP